MRVITKQAAKVGSFAVPKGEAEVPGWVAAQLEAAGVLKKPINVEVEVVEEKPKKTRKRRTKKSK